MALHRSSNPSPWGRASCELIRLLLPHLPACRHGWATGRKKTRIHNIGMNMIIEQLKTLDETRGDDIERWFASKTPRGCAPSSTVRWICAIRRCALVPVDTNLYPAGFNNLSPRARAQLRVSSFRFVEGPAPKAQKSPHHPGEPHAISAIWKTLPCCRIS